MIKKKKTKLISKPISKNLKSFRLAKHEDVFSRTRPDGEVVIVKISCDQHFFQLDKVAAEFWSLIDGKKTVQNICSILTKKHRAPEQSLQKSANHLVSDLLEHELIKNVSV